MAPSKVLIVLVEPQYSGNVGAVARAMKNTGLSQLVVVAPPALDPEHARWMAPGCEDLVASMRIVGTLDEALVGAHRVIASTARHRRQQNAVLTPAEVATQIADDPDDRVTAVLFGREDFGLSAADVLRSEAVLRIPTPEHASLNLAQAVLLVGYAIFEAAAARDHALASGRTIGGKRGTHSTTSLVREDARADAADMEPVVADLVALLARAGYPADPDKISATARSGLQRAEPGRREISALRGMLRRLRAAVDRKETD